MYLNTHSYYSLKYGTLSVEDVIKTAIHNNISAVALTDINNTSGHMRFVQIAKRYNLHPVLGIDFRNAMTQMYVGLAKNNQGYAELNEHLSQHLHHHRPFLKKAPLFNHAFIIYPFQSLNGYRKLEDHEYVGISPQDINKLKFSPWHKHVDKLVLLNHTSFRNKKDFNAHRLLRTIDNNTLLSKLPIEQQASEFDRFLTMDDLRILYEDYPMIINNTEKLLAHCSVDFEFGGGQPHKNLKTYTGSTVNDLQLLRKLCTDGLHYRYLNPTQEILDRIDKEINIIEKKGFLSYFLINWDIINYAYRQGYFYVGRGSGANSIVAYLLKITNVDPIALDLYFERFINLYRKNPPDFDLDFSSRDRDDVTQYIFSRFPNSALLATYNTFQPKAMIRELGKALGLPKAEIDVLSKIDKHPQTLNHISKLVLQYSEYIKDIPSHLSVHAGGIIISDIPMCNYTATFLPPKGYATTQFDMHIAEDIGLNKLDILGQRGLGKIKDTLEIVRKNNPAAPPIDIHDMQRFTADEKVKILLRNGKTMGCFYVESPAMRTLLSKLNVDHYLGLVAASSIIRPGVAKSGMMREYILRAQIPENRKDIHPVLYDIMPDTFGVMVYQEDVIKVAHYFAGLTLAESDVLRRGMSGKFRSRQEFLDIQDRFFERAIERGHHPSFVADIWRQIESFAGYAFSKGHSASYAVESYQSLFLKAHYPLEYMVAVLNNGGGFYHSEFYVHEARMLGAEIQAPDINISDKYAVIHKKTIYLGLGIISELEQKTIYDILQEREHRGPFLSFDDFIKRVSISVEQISILIRINAFRFTEINKRALIWHAHIKLNKTTKHPKQYALFESEPKKFTLPQLSYTELENAYDQIELIGFSLYDPFLLLASPITSKILASDLEKHLNKTVEMIGHLVNIKKTRTLKGAQMFFGTFLDQDGYFFDTVHFPNPKIPYPFKGKGIYKLVGKVTQEFNFYSLEVFETIRLPNLADPRYSEPKAKKASA